MESKSFNTISGANDSQEFIQAQIAEMEKFKWFLGEELGHDPLEDRSINEIYCEWIQMHGASFRIWWEKGRRNGQEFSLGRKPGAPAGKIFNSAVCFLKALLTSGEGRRLSAKPPA